MLLRFVLLAISLLGCWASSPPDVNCLIINLEYIKCTWNHTQNPEVNYTFQSRFRYTGSYKHCPTYLQEAGHSVGCRLPYEMNQKFFTLQIKLSQDDNSTERHQNISLHDLVLLNPPYNLTVELSPSNQELWLYWNTSAPSTCVESQVRYKKDNGQWQESNLAGSWSYSLTPVSKKHQYQFQVRSRIPHTCHKSKFWSNWSSPVLWRSGQKEVMTDVTRSSGVLYPVVGGLAFLLLVALTVALVQGERLRVIFVPVVPKPGGNMQGLIDFYNGNVEEWLNISKEFKAGFEPNLHEPACPVRERSLLPETASIGSHCSHPFQTDQPHRISSLESTSNLSSPPNNIPPGLV